MLSLVAFGREQASSSTKDKGEAKLELGLHLAGSITPVLAARQLSSTASRGGRGKGEHGKGGSMLMDK